MIVYFFLLYSKREGERERSRKSYNFPEVWFLSFQAGVFITNQQLIPYNAGLALIPSGIELVPHYVMKAVKLLDHRTGTCVSECVCVSVCTHIF